MISSAASVNATNAKASSGVVYSLVGYSQATSQRYLKVYNKASAPTVGTDTPVMTIVLPPMTAFVVDLDGLTLSNGIGYGFTTGIADNNTGALAAGDVIGFNLVYG
jgi:hypothetical protein